MKIDNEWFAVGVHSGGVEDEYNVGSYFQDFFGLRELFKEDSFFGPSYSKFDEFLRN